MKLILRIFLVLYIFHTCYAINGGLIKWSNGDTTPFRWRAGEIEKHFINKDVFEGIQSVFERREELIEGERAAATILLTLLAVNPSEKENLFIENPPEVTFRTERISRKKTVTIPTGIKFKTSRIGAQTIYPTIEIRKNGRRRNAKMKDFTSGNTIFSEMNAISMAKTSIAGNELFTRKPNDRKPDDNRWNDQNGNSVTKVDYIPNDGDNKPAYQISWIGRREEDLVDVARNGGINVNYQEDRFPFSFSGGIGATFEIGHYNGFVPSVRDRGIPLNNKQRWNECINKIC